MARLYTFGLALCAALLFGGAATAAERPCAHHDDAPTRCVCAEDGAALSPSPDATASACCAVAPAPALPTALNAPAETPRPDAPGAASIGTPAPAPFSNGTSDWNGRRAPPPDSKRLHLVLAVWLN